MTHPKRFLIAFASILAFLSATIAEEARPPLATPEEAAAAITKFEEDFKAKGLKGDDRLAAREEATRTLAKTQHPTVADRLVKLAGQRDADLKTLGMIYLGTQRGLPGYAGKLVLALIEKNVTDPVSVMFCVDAILELDFRGQVPVLRSLLQSKDESLRKHALATIGDMKEMRMIEDVLKLMVDLKIDKGVKWEGGEVTVDTGAPGDADQKAAEAAYAAAYGQNAAKGKSAGRKMRDMKPTLLDAMKKLTGTEFAASTQAAQWIKDHKAEIEAQQKALNDIQKAQETAAKAMGR